MRRHKAVVGPEVIGCRMADANIARPICAPRCAGVPLRHYAIFHSLPRRGFMPLIGAAAWRAKATQTCKKRGQEVCPLCMRSRKIRPCDSMLPQLLRTPMDR